jgi:membrane protein DedA with SNARE-associated domain
MTNKESEPDATRCLSAKMSLANRIFGLAPVAPAFPGSLSAVLAQLRRATGNRAVVFITAALLPTLGISFAAIFFRHELQELSTLGYIGIFLANLASSASMFLPLPGVSLTFVAASVWNPVGIALVGEVGSTLGEGALYMAGVGSRGAVNKYATRFRWYPRVESWMERRGGVTLLVLASVPGPLFDFAGFAAGATKYPFRRYAIAVMIGRLVKYSLVVMAGYWGAPILIGLFVQ